MKTMSMALVCVLAVGWMNAAIGGASGKVSGALPEAQLKLLKKHSHVTEEPTSKKTPMEQAQ